MKRKRLTVDDLMQARAVLEKEGIDYTYDDYFTQKKAEMEEAVIKQAFKEYTGHPLIAGDEKRIARAFSENKHSGYFLLVDNNVIGTVNYSIRGGAFCIEFIPKNYE